jgi:hypothetical protein
MALNLSGDMALYDVKRLIYSLLVVSYEDRFSNNLIQDQALEMIFETQRNNPNALWPTGQLIPLSVDGLMAVSSIQCVRDLLDNEAIFKKLVKWLPEVKAIYDFHARTIRMNKDRTELTGWYPPDFRDKTPLSYVTAFVLSFIKKFCSLLSLKIKELAKENFKIRYRKPTMIWSDICDSLSAKSKLLLIAKSFEDSQGKIGGSSKKAKDKLTSAILFGIPGTGKTSYARALAAQMGWEYLELTPGMFFSGTSIIENINSIFEHMLHLEKTVVFIDEIDDLIRERKKEDDKPAGAGGAYDPRNMYVNTLLPRFQELHDNQNIVLILATNHYKDVDRAIKRLGRIDLVIPIGPVSPHGRLAMFYKEFAGLLSSGGDSERKDILTVFLRQTGKITYAELKLSLKKISDIVERNGLTNLEDKEQARQIQDAITQSITRRNEPEFEAFLDALISNKKDSYTETRPPSGKDCKDIEALESNQFKQSLEDFLRFAHVMLTPDLDRIKKEASSVGTFVEYCKGGSLYSIITPFYDELEKLSKEPGGDPFSVWFTGLERFILSRELM